MELRVTRLRMEAWIWEQLYLERKRESRSNWTKNGTKNVSLLLGDTIDLEYKHGTRSK